jgi:hypothetical protein
LSFIRNIFLKIIFSYKSLPPVGIELAAFYDDFTTAKTNLYFEFSNDSNLHLTAMINLAHAKSKRNKTTLSTVEAPVWGSFKNSSTKKVIIVIIIIIIIIKALLLQVLNRRIHPYAPHNVWQIITSQLHTEIRDLFATHNQLNMEQILQDRASSNTNNNSDRFVTIKRAAAIAHLHFHPEAQTCLAACFCGPPKTGTTITIKMQYIFYYR